MSEISSLCKSGFYSIELRSDNENSDFFVEVKDKNVEFCELQEFDCEILPEIFEDLDLVLKHFCDVVAGVDKADSEGLENIILRFKEKIQEIMFNFEIFGEDLVGIVKNKFFAIYSGFDREHSSALINLRNCLIEKCRMPLEVKKFLIRTVTIDEVNSRFQERVLMMKDSDLAEIRKAFEECYERFIVDRSCIDEEFLIYDEIMKQVKTRIIERMSQDLFDYIKNKLVSSEYQWIVIKGLCFDRHISSLPKKFDLTLSPIDAIFTLKGKYQIEHFSKLKPGILLLITSKEKVSNNYTENTNMSLLLFYHAKKRKGLKAFDGLVQIASGSDSNNLITLQKKLKKLSKMVLVYGRFVECKEYKIDPLILQEIKLITYNNISEKIVFATNNNQLYILNENNSIQVINEGNKIHWIRFLSYLNIFIMINNDIIEFFDSEFSTIAKIYLYELGGLFLSDFIDNQNYKFVGLTTIKRKFCFSNVRQNNIFYYKVDLGEEFFRTRSRKSIVSTIIDIVAYEVNPTFKELIKDKCGFDSIKVKSAFGIYTDFVKSVNEISCINEKICDVEDHESA